MNNSTIVFLINDHVRAISAEYEEDGPPEIFKTFDPDISVDDLVVVESGTRHKQTVVKVRAVDIELDFDTSTKVKWVVQRIDQTSYKRALAEETEAITAVQSAERARKRRELRENLFKDHQEQINQLKLANHEEDDGLTE